MRNGVRNALTAGTALCVKNKHSDADGGNEWFSYCVIEFHFL